MEEAVILGSFGILKSTINQDILTLFTQYFKADKFGFTHFKHVWDSIQFGLFHFACTEKAGRPSFMQAFYQCVLGYLYKSSSRLEMHTAVIYALYMLYSTQPECFERVYIRLTSEQTHKIQQTLMKCQQDNVYLDSLYIVKHMLEECSFLIVATEYRQVMSGLTEQQDDVELDVLLARMENDVYTRNLVQVNGLEQQCAQIHEQYKRTKDESGVEMATEHTQNDVDELARDVQTISTRLQVKRNIGLGGMDWKW